MVVIVESVLWSLDRFHRSGIAVSLHFAGTMTAEQDGDGQARSRFELIDFPDSKLYSPIEAALPDRAAMPPRSLMNIFLEWISPILFGFGTPIVMVFVGRAMILNRDGDRSKPSVAIPASGKSKKAQGAVNVLSLIHISEPTRPY